MTGTIEGALKELEMRNLGTESRMCGCIGPQNGEPLCPCMMRGVVIRDGRYVRVEDLGPVKEGIPRNFAAEMNALQSGMNSFKGPNVEAGMRIARGDA